MSYVHSYFLTFKVQIGVEVDHHKQWSHVDNFGGRRDVNKLNEQPFKFHDSCLPARAEGRQKTIRSKAIDDSAQHSSERSPHGSQSVNF